MSVSFQKYRTCASITFLKRKEKQRKKVPESSNFDKENINELNIFAFASMKICILTRWLYIKVYACEGVDTPFCIELFLRLYVCILKTFLSHQTNQKHMRGKMIPYDSVAHYFKHLWQARSWHDLCLETAFSDQVTLWIRYRTHPTSYYKSSRLCLGATFFPILHQWIT